MRKLYSFMVTTLDGFHEGTDGEFDWPNVDDEFHAFSERQLNDIDTLLFGRRTYEGMASFWLTAEAKDALPITAERRGRRGSGGRIGRRRQRWPGARG